MTSKLTKQKKDYGTLEIFPDFPPRDDMQNALHLHRPSLQAALTEHLGNFDSTIVLSEIPVRWTPGQRRGHRIPDLLVAFDIDREQAEFQNGYSIRDLGKPPDFVLEVASWRTAENDVGPKRRDYANFGIPEYWRFDPTGNQRYDVPLAGDRLVGSAYQPMEVMEVEPGHIHGRSDVLNLSLCWNHGNLRWYDNDEGLHLLTHAEERQARIAEQEMRIAEQEARARAEAQASTEAGARAAAEARIRQLEEELRNRGDRSESRELAISNSTPSSTANISKAAMAIATAPLPYLSPPPYPSPSRGRELLQCSQRQAYGAIAVIVWRWDSLLSPIAKGATTGSCRPAARRRSRAALHSSGLPITATWSCISRVTASDALARSPAASASAASAISSPKPVSTKKLR